MRSICRCGVAVALGRTQVAWLHAAKIYDEFLENDARIHHPELQSVITWLGQGVLGFHFADAVSHRLFPVFLRVVCKSIYHLGRLIIERNRIPQAAARDEVQGWSEDSLHFDRA